MKLKKNGFTLVELLAVITVLAIIALIVIPLVTSSIKNSKVESSKRSLDLYGRAVELSVSNKMVSSEVTPGNYSTVDGVILTNDKNETLTVEFQGNKIICGVIKISEEGEVYLNKCSIDGKAINAYYGIKPETLSTLVSGDSETVGSVFKVKVGDNISEDFYLIGFEGNNAMLLMTENLISDGINYHDAASNLSEATVEWTKINSSQISLPTYTQIYSIDNSANLKSWLLNGAYWLNDGSAVWPYGGLFYCGGLNGTEAYNICDLNGNGYGEGYGQVGIRPVITIPKGELE